MDEKKRLWQECLPGVTIYGRQNSHRGRQEDDDDKTNYGGGEGFSCHQRRQEQHPLLDFESSAAVPSTYINGNTVDSTFNAELNTSSEHSVSSLHILWLESDSDDLDDDRHKYHNMNDDDCKPHHSRKRHSSHLKLHQAAAVAAAANRGTRHLHSVCSKIGVSLLIALIFLWRHHQRSDRDGPFENINVDISPSLNDDDAALDLFFSDYEEDILIVETTQNHSSASSLEKIIENVDDDDRRTRILIALKNLDEEIEGDIVLVSNKTKFLVAAQVWQTHPRPPLAVVEATSSKDVALAMPILAGLRRDFGLEFRVRSGGHTYYADYSNVPDGVVLSLSRLQKWSFGNLTQPTGTVSPVSGSKIRLEDQKAEKSPQSPLSSSLSTTSPYTTLTLQPGVTTKQFMKEILDEHGYSGVVASAANVGMGGFVLGGGYGLQSRMYGLAIDNVVRFKAVLTNGTEKVVEEGDDLFWALRGGGGANFAVVTETEYRVYPSKDIKLCASVKLDLDALSQFLQQVGAKEHNLAPEFTLSVEGYRRPENSTSPDAWRLRRVQRLLSQNRTLKDDDKIGLVDVKMYWMGDASPDSQIGMNYIKTQVAPLLENSIALKIVYYYFSWSGLSREREQNNLWKSVWSAQSWNGFLLLNNNTQQVWVDIVSSFEAIFRYCNYAAPKIDLWGGAVAKKAANTSAFPHRNALYSIGVELLVPNGKRENAANDQVELINAIWPSIARHLTGVYVNQPMSSLSKEDYPAAYWGGNLDKLVLLKQKYDPFHALVHDQPIPTINATIQARKPN